MCSLCVHLMADGWAEGGSCGFPIQRGAFRSHQPAAPASTFPLTAWAEPSHKPRWEESGLVWGQGGWRAWRSRESEPTEGPGPPLVSAAGIAQEESSLPKAGLGSQRPSAS